MKLDPSPSSGDTFLLRFAGAFLDLSMVAMPLYAVSGLLLGWDPLHPLHAMMAAGVGLYWWARLTGHPPAPPEPPLPAP